MEPEQIDTSFPVLVCKELEDLRGSQTLFNGEYEGYALLLEQLETFWMQVKMRQDSDRKKMLQALVQMAALAQHVAEESALIKPDKGGQ